MLSNSWLLFYLAFYFPSDLKRLRYLWLNMPRLVCRWRVKRILVVLKAWKKLVLSSSMTDTFVILKKVRQQRITRTIKTANMSKTNSDDTKYNTHMCWCIPPMVSQRTLFIDENIVRWCIVYVTSIMCRCVSSQFHGCVELRKYQKAKNFIGLIITFHFFFFFVYSRKRPDNTVSKKKSSVVKRLCRDSPNGIYFFYF